VLYDRQASPNRKAKPAQAQTANGGHHRAAGPPGVIAISALTSYRRATVAGRVHTLEIRPVEGSSVLACAITDTSGELTALFYGRTHITGLRPGSNVQLRGTVSITGTGAVMINPAYALID
jgi:RecG-like helicase